MTSYFNSHNPILPLEHHVPDGEAHVFSDGKLYIYGSYDCIPGAYCSDRYHVVSTPDMKNWTVHDVSFRGQDVPWYGNREGMTGPAYENSPSGYMEKFKGEPRSDNPDVALDAGPLLPYLYAPDAIEKDGKFYLYFCCADGSEGVAVSDKPEGPFTNPVKLPCGGIDPAIFVDDDGRAYYYWGQFYPKGVELNPDMVSFDPEKIVYNIATEEEHFFHEGSSLRKIGDTYYFVFSCMEHGRPTSLGYATGKNPLGPFTYGGVIIDNCDCDPESWNDHGSIECFNGQYYVFYHRSSRGGRINRRLCIEPITINPDGSIDEVKMTSQGPGAPFGPGEKIMGYQACGLSGSCLIDADANHGESLQRISAGDTAIFRYVKSDSPYTAANIECEGEGSVRIYLNGNCSGEGALKPGMNEIPVSAEAGQYELKVEFTSASDLKLISITLK